MNLRSLNQLRPFLPTLVVLLLGASRAEAAWPSDPTTNVPLCLAAGHQGTPAAISDGKGGAFVVWNDLRGGTYDVYMQRVDATGAPRWTTDGIVVCNAASDQFEPSIASDGAGGAIVAWSDGRGTSYDIYAQRVDSMGVVKWAANGLVISAAANTQWQARVLSDGGGGAFLAWTDERAANGFGRIYVQHINSSGAALWTTNGVSTNNSLGGEDYPWLISNGSGGILVAWQDFRSGDTDIYTQRVLSTGAVDPAWPVGGRQMCSLFQEQEIGGLVPDGAGGALVTWPQWNGFTRDIFVHHVLATGALDPAWPGAGRRLALDSPDQCNPGIVPDGSGGVLVAYLDMYSTQVRARHVSASGAVDAAWPDTGLVLCEVSGEKLFPIVVPSDTAAIVVWQDKRDGNWDLYAQRFLRNGVLDPSWPTGGRAVTTANLNQVGHAVAFDATGGVIVAWDDRRTAAGPFGDDGEIFAQLLRANGQLGDPPVGVPDSPSFDFALHSQNPVRARALQVRFTLPSSAPASLEVFNVAGRRMTGREVAGAGSHAVDLDWGAIPGVYFVRLSQGAHSNVRRIVLLD